MPLRGGRMKGTWLETNRGPPHHIWTRTKRGPETSATDDAAGDL